MGRGREHRLAEREAQMSKKHVIIPPAAPDRDQSPFRIRPQWGLYCFSVTTGSLGQRERERGKKQDRPEPWEREGKNSLFFFFWPQ